uniref:U-box domain-containing protein n=1 Tax=Zooxanthella nutricula TaxID=1333877 RepID=A0A7S2LKD5_9DINO
MPMLPLHLLSASKAGSRRGGRSMRQSLSACSLDSNLSHGGGQSDVDSQASLSLGPSTSGLPASLRIGDLPSVPDCFKCKFSQQVMQDPVRLPDGSACDRANAISFGVGHAAKTDCVLAEAIKGYFELRKESERQQREWQACVVSRSQRAQRKLLQRQQQVYALRVALERSRKKIQALEEKSIASTTASSISPDSSHRGDTALFDAGGGGEEAGALAGPAPQPLFRSGPAPRAEAATPATRRLSATSRRRSSWSLLSGIAS